MVQVQTITRYERGTNAILDAVYQESDGALWVVHGSRGRLLILEDTSDEAKRGYIEERLGGRKRDI